MKSLILHNLKKARGQLLSFGIVMMITALILNTALVLLSQTSTAYDSLFDELHTADLSVAIPSVLSDEKMTQEILALNGVSDIDTKEALFAASALQDFKDSEFTMNTYFYRMNDARNLTRHTLLEQTQSNEGMGVYIPFYLSKLGGYQTGKSLRCIIGGTEYQFTVRGVLCEMQYGNYGTGFIGLYLTDEAYEKLKTDEAFAPVCEYLIKAEENADLAKIRKDIGTLLKERNIPVMSFLDSQTTKGSRTMVSGTIVLFLAAFAALVLLVSIFLCRFRIKTTIDEEINEMGVLKGIGYTSRMLKYSQVIPYLLVTSIGLICGVASSYGLIPVIANVLAVQSGFSYTPVVDISAAFITVLSILTVVFLFTILAAGKIKRLEPVDAIRGIEPDRRASASGGRNFLLFAVSFVMMMLFAFTGILLYNVDVHPDNFLTTLSEELPDIRMQTYEEKYDDLKDRLEKENVKAVGYGVVMTEYTDGSIPTIVCEDFSLLENDIAYEGKHPQKEDEIAVGSKFADDYKIGDKFRLTLNGREYEYTITGFIQSVNNNGLIVEVTESGYAQISDVSMDFLNLYLPEHADVSLYVDKLNSEYDDYVINVSNMAKESESMRKMYSSLMSAAAAVLFVITLLIIFLILYVILHSMIVSRKTEFGIYKAIGYTSRQLVIQTVGSIAPVIFSGALLSAIFSVWYLPVMFGSIFGVIGALKNNFEIPLYILLIMALLLTITNIVMGAALCRPIKNINAYALIKE